MEDVLSIAQFAEAVGVSKQAIYKQVKNENSKLYPFIIFDGKTPWIKVEAVEALYHTNQPNSTQEVEKETEENQPNQPNSTQDFNPNSTQEVEKVENENQPNQPKSTQDFNQILAILMAQLAEKDKQIAKLQEQNARQAEENSKKDEVIQEQLIKMNELLRNAQQLQAQSNVLLLENKPEEEITELKSEERNKKGWLYKLFFGE
jgi:hypothetical protein